MNFSIIRKTLGFLLVFEGVFFLVPAITAICYGEWLELLVFLACSVVCAGLGVLCIVKKVRNNQMYAKEGFVIVALSWVFMSLFGSLPVLLLGSVSFIDALFDIFTLFGDLIKENCGHSVKNFVCARTNYGVSAKGGAVHSCRQNSCALTVTKCRTDGKSAAESLCKSHDVGAYSALLPCKNVA